MNKGLAIGLGLALIVIVIFIIYHYVQKNDASNESVEKNTDNIDALANVVNSIVPMEQGNYNPEYTPEPNPADIVVDPNAIMNQSNITSSITAGQAAANATAYLVDNVGNSMANSNPCTFDFPDYNEETGYCEKSSSSNFSNSNFSNSNFSNSSFSNPSSLLLLDF